MKPEKLEMNIFLYVTLLVKMNRVNNNIKLCCGTVVVVVVGVIAIYVCILGIGIGAARYARQIYTFQ